MVEDTPVVGFIAGMSRSGTTFLMNCLNSHPEIVCFGESIFWGREYVTPLGPRGTYSADQVAKILHNCKAGNWGPGAKASCNRTMKGAEEPLSSAFDSEFRDLLVNGATARTVFDAIARAMCRAHGKSFAIEKTPHHVHFVDRIRLSYPHAKFVITQRNPYDFMLSYKHQGGQVGSQTRSIFERTYHPLLCAIVCRKYLRSTARALSQYPDDTLCIDTERLQSEAQDVFREVLDFLGMARSPLTEPIMGKNSSFEQSDEKPRLEPADVFWMNLVNGRWIKKARWPLQASKASGWQVVRSILQLPGSLFHILRILMAAPGNQLKYLIKLLR